MDHQALKACIDKVLLLADEDYALLMTCVTTRELKKGQQLLSEGEVCNTFYLVDKGYLRTYYNKDGAAINLNFTFERDFTTNLHSYKNREPSTFVIEAGEDTAVWLFNIKILSGHVNHRPEISKFIRRLAIDMLLATEQYNNLFKTQTPTERYRYIEQNNPQLLQRVSLSQLSSYLGVARETLSRIRAKN